MSDPTSINPQIYKRLAIINYTKTRSIKLAARTFKISVPTIIKWLQRYEQYGIIGLFNIPKSPDKCKHKIIKFWEFKIKDVYNQYKSFRMKTSAQMIKQNHNVPYSVQTINKVIRSLHN